ncbi:hypothetical protein GURASL_18870 [Geotalea uraniireducens]|uniref:Transcriptional regulator n=1 Tax=Geotalea uraniireducens TaxID=351604 RepID=A0ABM8EKW4_9BACT|nr:hypothetical protein [Geotalea uraniireducens]BDV42964.1 hypothetical protein GURASL_18870 [Geotalea uraniireducens]
MVELLQQDEAAGQSLVESLWIREPREAFSRLSETFAMTRWQVRSTAGGCIAETSFCTLAAQAKALGAASPCRHYCLDPLAAMVRSLAPQSRFTVCETLWAGERCLVEVG